MLPGAMEKVRGENLVRKVIEEGMSARQAFDTYGVMKMREKGSGIFGTLPIRLRLLSWPPDV